MNGLTNATSWDVAWCPKHQTAKWCCWFDGHSLTRLGSQKTWIFISLHRLQIRHSKILLILVRPLPIGYFTSYYFSFFLIFNRMDAWSLMRGDAFIHFVCGSRRVNIRLGVLLLIPKSPHNTHRTLLRLVSLTGGWYMACSQPGGHRPFRLTCLLWLTDWLTAGVEKLPSIYIFWTPIYFPSSTIHVIHYRCLLFTLITGAYPVYETHTYRLSKVNI